MPVQAGRAYTLLCRLRRQETVDHRCAVLRERGEPIAGSPIRPRRKKKPVSSFMRSPRCTCIRGRIAQRERYPPTRALTTGIPTRKQHPKRPALETDRTPASCHRQATASGRSPNESVNKWHSPLGPVASCRLVFASLFRRQDSGDTNQSIQFRIPLSNKGGQNETFAVTNPHILRVLSSRG